MTFDTKPSAEERAEKFAADARSEGQEPDGSPMGEDAMALARTLKTIIGTLADEYQWTDRDLERECLIAIHGHDNVRHSVKA